MRMKAFEERAGTECPVLIIKKLFLINQTGKCVISVKPDKLFLL